MIPNVDNSDVVAGVSNGRSSPAAAVPPSGYVLAGQMNLGAINVPALNSANLSELNEFDHYTDSSPIFCRHLKGAKSRSKSLCLWSHSDQKEEKRGNEKNYVGFSEVTIATKRVSRGGIAFPLRICPKICTIWDAPRQMKVKCLSRSRARLH